MFFISIANPASYVDILVGLLKKENTILTTIVWKLKIIAQCQLSQTIEDHYWKSNMYLSFNIRYQIPTDLVVY